MKILHFHPTMTSGGIEAMICSLANQMSLVGHDVTVATIFAQSGDDIFLKKLSPNIHKITLGKRKTGISFIEIFKIYNTIKSGGYDVVNIHGFFYYYLVAILLLHNKVKFFYTVHSDAFKENSFWDKKIFRLKKRFFTLGWMLPITISKTSGNSFTECYGIESALIYNGTPKAQIDTGTDLSEYKITSATKILFHPGRISEAKNQLMLCSVCQRLINEKFDIVLLIAGANQDEKIMSELIPYMSQRIIYLGERSDVMQIMCSADAFCLSSIWEGMPVTLLEALSIGCTPICTPVGGIPEAIIDRSNGFLAKSVSEEDYYNAVKAYLQTDEKELCRIKENSIRSFEKFDIESTANNYLKLYRKYTKL